jgi:hypothetical protein
LRFLFHFHDPLRPIDGAGLGIGPARFASSIKWMQDSAQFWSWPSARVLYYNALTETDPIHREALWADLFRALGQMMHLVVDASVPEHTRNDMHPLGAMKLENSYEQWVGSQHAGGQEAAFVAKYLALPIGLSEAISGDVGQLVDADRYDGGNPGITVGADSRAPVAAGLAEIANANFFSEDTLRGRYPSPTDAGLIPVALTTPLGKVRRYFSRPAGRGLLPANPLKAECASDAIQVRSLPVEPPPYPCVDPLVWGQVATHMLPRAVGYARGVLDYFFRGTMRVSRAYVDDPVPGQEIPGQTGMWIDIENTSHERMEGRFEVYARYDRGTPLERRLPAAIVNDGVPALIEPGGTRRLRLRSLDAPAAAHHVLVFRGRLGSEDEAVAGQVFSVPHVQMIQANYDADISKSCSTFSYSSASIPLGERLRCSWQPINHRAHVRLQTNFGSPDNEDQDAPRIERIQVLWTGAVPGEAQLTVQGVTYANGTWERTGPGPDPEDLAVADPIVRRDSSLWLRIWVRGTVPFFTTQLATFKGLVQDSEEKKVQGLWGAGHWMLYSLRTVRIPLNVSSATHAAGSIGGFPSPTPLIMRDQLSEFPLIMRETLEVTGVQGTHRVISNFTLIPMTPDADYRTPFDRIRLEAPWPTPPALHWGAEVTPRALAEWPLEFWRTFVDDEEPAAIPIVMTGHEPAP